MYLSLSARVFCFSAQLCAFLMRLHGLFDLISQLAGHPASQPASQAAAGISQVFIIVCKLWEKMHSSPRLRHFVTKFLVAIMQSELWNQPINQNAILKTLAAAASACHMRQQWLEGHRVFRACQCGSLR